ncbi:MAG: purine phosphorylase [Rhodospirillum sp.]|nr:purine phosphorylase [Rhodospirillum sp.]MCF8489546.1 purine phosphorylase [Rhodospirillum sp.]MCF8499735.1 purine phosphorylase [Rhodospirillum sp.]
MSTSVGAKKPPRNSDRLLTTLGVVTGLAMEAALIPVGTRPRLITHCAGPGPDAAAKAAWRLLEQGCEGLVSFGTAGGLDPSLASGTLILATEVRALTGAPAIPVDSAARLALMETCKRRGLPFAEGALLGSDTPILTPRAKTELFEETGALAVDMESHRVAEIAQDAGLPFLAVRVVADPANRSVPAWALKGIDAKGETRALPILLAVLLAPWRIPALIHLAQDSARASATLEAVSQEGLGG